MRCSPWAMRASKEMLGQNGGRFSGMDGPCCLSAITWAAIRQAVQSQCAVIERNTSEIGPTAESQIYIRHLPPRQRQRKQPNR